MLTAETLRRIRRIELRTRRLVDESFAGAYHAIFKGRGIEFDQVRPYEAGDDIRLIDWNVTARIGEPFVKQYVEERELTVLLLLDTSASCLFGTTKQQKRDAAVEMAAVLAYAAIRNQDRVGLILFSDQIELYVPPHKGRNHILRLIRDLLAAQPSRKGTDIALALHMANRLAKHHAVIFLLSDFLLPAESYATELALVAQRHDLIAGVLSDPLEQSWPDVGLVALRDAETGIERWIDTTPKTWRDQYRHQTQRFRSLRDAALSHANVDRIDLPSDGDYVSALLAFFRRRMSRIRT
jgi:uncharacterized protein (DUF58 family)